VLCTASSYYPGHGDTTHPLVHLDPNNHDTDAKDQVIETKEDWMGDDHVSNGQPSKISEAVASEVSV
jgi:hypothetical protein